MFIDGTISRKCRHRGKRFLISNSFKNEERVCVCFKIVTDIDKFGEMHKIWVNNSKQRACTNLWRSFTDEIVKKEELADKYGCIDLNKYNEKTTSH